ncbi:MAG: hypothetical protein PHC61_07520 [Chitinivibrionales bacterium]|nr:hypothetical protein [Chitinivibrionales bacterium]
MDFTLDQGAAPRQRRPRRSAPPVLGLVALTLTALLILTVLAIRIFAVKSAVQRQVAFDPQKNIRLPHVSRVYRIRQDPREKARIWFATAEGLRSFNNQTFAWTRYGLDHGLPSEVITDLCFAKGELFVSTDRGVARLNAGGQKFTGIKMVPSVKDAVILSVESGPDGSVFCGKSSGGLAAITAGDSLMRPLRIGGIGDSEQVSCIRNFNDTLFFGLAGMRVLKWHAGMSRAQAYIFNAKKISHATAIWDLIMHRGRLWAATSDNGLWFERGASDTLDEEKEFPAKGAFVLTESEDGVWCGTPWGLWRRYDATGVWLQFMHPQERSAGDFGVVALLRCGDTLWYGSQELGGGFLTTRFVQWKPLRAGLSNPNVAALAATDSFLWTAYGYQGGYLDKFSAADVQYLRNYNSQDGLSDPNIACMAADGTRCYLGGFESFVVIDLKTGGRKVFAAGAKLPAGDIACLALDEKDNVYLGSQFGVITYRAAGDSLALLAPTRPYRVTAIALDKQDLWIGTLGQGVRRFDRATGRETGACLTDTRMIVGIALYQDSGKASLFAATREQGCFKIDGASGQSAPLPLPAQLFSQDQDQNSRQIMASRVIDGRIWLGTRDAGCIIYDPAYHRWKTITYFDGLVSNQVRSFCETGEYVWIGAYGGVNRIEKKSLHL